MKHLKKYNLFERASEKVYESKYEVTEDDIQVCNDMLLELKDEGFEAKITPLGKAPNDLSFLQLYISKPTHVKKGRQHTIEWNIVKKEDLKVNFGWNDIKDYVRPVMDYLEDLGYEPSDYTGLTTAYFNPNLDTIIRNNEYLTKFVIYFKK